MLRPALHPRHRPSDRPVRAHLRTPVPGVQRALHPRDRGPQERHPLPRGPQRPGAPRPRAALHHPLLAVRRAGQTAALRRAHRYLLLAGVCPVAGEEDFVSHPISTNHPHSTKS